MKVYIYGRNPVIEALKQDFHPVKRIYISRKRRGSIEEIEFLACKKGVPVQETSESTLSGMASTGKHQGVVADVEFVYRELEELENARVIVVLDHIQDPHNLGAIVRTAAALGADGVVIPKDRAVHVTPAVVKVSEGNVFKIPVVMVVNISRTLEGLKERGFWVYGADMRGKSVLETRFVVPSVIVFGNEGRGLSRLVKEKCDELVSIPMKKRVESLNVSVSAGILMFEVLNPRNLFENSL